jgi:hypothetical protein
MIKRPKPTLEWQRRSADLLDPRPSFSDRTLRAVLRRGVRGPTRFDDLMSAALVVLLGTAGLVIGWALFLG